MKSLQICTPPATQTLDKSLVAVNKEAYEARSGGVTKRARGTDRTDFQSFAAGF